MSGQPEPIVGKKFKKNAVSPSPVNRVHPKTVNMTLIGLPFLEYLSRLTELAKIAAPDDRAGVDEFILLNKKAFEVDEEGLRTPGAGEARRKLENPEMVSTPMKRGIAAKHKKLLKYSKRATAAFAEATAAAGLLAQAELEMRIFEEAELLPDNRKAHPSLENAESDLQYIDTWLRDMGVKPYELGRLSSAERGVIERLLKDARGDPDYSRPDNLWPLLFNAGVLSVTGATPTQHQKDLMAEAWDRNHYDYGDLLTQLQDRTGQRLDVTASFAAGCELVARRAAALGSVEAMLLFCAYGEKISLEAEIVSALMNIPADDRYRVQGAIQSIRLSGEVAHATEHNDLAKATASIISCLNECHTREHQIEEWVGIVIHNYFEKASCVTKVATDGEKFWALFALALRLSGLDTKYRNYPTPALENDVQFEDYVPEKNNNFDRAWEFRYHAQAAADAATTLDATPISPAAEAAVPAPDDAAFANANTSEFEAEEPASSSHGNDLVLWPDSSPGEPEVLIQTKQPEPYLHKQQITKGLFESEKGEDLE